MTLPQLRVVTRIRQVAEVQLHFGVVPSRLLHLLLGRHFFFAAFDSVLSAVEQEAVSSHGLSSPFALELADAPFCETVKNASCVAVHGNRSSICLM